MEDTGIYVTRWQHRCHVATAVEHYTKRSKFADWQVHWQAILAGICKFMINSRNQGQVKLWDCGAIYGIQENTTLSVGMERGRGGGRMYQRSRVAEWVSASGGGGGSQSSLESPKRNKR